MIAMVGRNMTHLHVRGEARRRGVYPRRPNRTSPAAQPLNCRSTGRNCAVRMYFRQPGFWIWLLVFYLYLLGLEVFLILSESREAAGWK